MPLDGGYWPSAKHCLPKNYSPEDAANDAEVLAALKARRDEIDKILAEHAAVLPINEVIVHDHGTAVLDIETGKWAK